MTSPQLTPQEVLKQQNDLLALFKAQETKLEQQQQQLTGGGNAGQLPPPQQELLRQQEHLKQQLKDQQALLEGQLTGGGNQTNLPPEERLLKLMELHEKELELQQQQLSAGGNTEPLTQKQQELLQKQQDLLSKQKQLKQQLQQQQQSGGGNQVPLTQQELLEKQQKQQRLLQEQQKLQEEQQSQLCPKTSTSSTGSNVDSTEKIPVEPVRPDLRTRVYLEIDKITAEFNKLRTVFFSCSTIPKLTKRIYEDITQRLEIIMNDLLAYNFSARRQTELRFKVESKLEAMRKEFTKLKNLVNDAQLRNSCKENHVCCDKKNFYLSL